MSDHVPGQDAANAPGPAPPGAMPEDLSQLIVAASADAIVAVDEQGIIRLCNKAAENLLGRDAAGLTGAPFGFPVAAGAAEVELVLPGGGGRVAEMRATTTTLEGKRLHVVSLRDVTRRREAERELEQALERQNVVVAVAAHELHNPLAAISMLAHVLAGQHVTMPPTQRAQIIDRIVERTARLQMLVRKLLTASRIDAVGIRAAPEPVPVLTVIIDQIAEADKRSEDVQVSCSPGLTALADPAEFSMILANYLDNALTYGAPPIEIRAAERDGWADVRVTDHGPGVSQAFVPRLFERFTREPGAGRKAEGTGLGLWIVRAYARANGGDAWYEPGAGGGSSFCLRLPLAQAPPEAPPS